MWIKINIETKLKSLEKISRNVDSLCTDYYVTVLNDQDDKNKNVTAEIRRTYGRARVLNQLLNSDIKEIRRSGECLLHVF